MLGRGGVEHRHPPARSQHPGQLGQAGVEVGEVPHPPADQRAVERAVREREQERVGDHRVHPVRLAAAELEHPAHEVHAHHPAAEAGLAGEDRREVEGPGAEVEVDSIRRPLPPESPHGVPAPAEIQPQAQNPIQPIVRRGDGGEHLADVGALLRPAGHR